MAERLDEDRRNHDRHRQPDVARAAPDPGRRAPPDGGDHRPRDRRGQGRRRRRRPRAARSCSSPASTAATPASARSPRSRTAGSSPTAPPPWSCGPPPGPRRCRRDRHRRRAVGRRPSRSTSPSRRDRTAGAGSGVPGRGRRPARPARRPAHERDAARRRGRPAPWPTPPGGGPTCRSSARSSCSRPSTSRSGSSRCSAWVKEALAELELTDRIRTDVTDGMEKTQREFLLRQQLARHPQGAGRGRRGRGPGRGLPRQAGRARELQPDDVTRAAIEREIDRLERTSRAEPPSTAGSAPGSTPSSSCRGA